MIWTSLAALAVNGGITLALVRGHGDLNLRSILVHNFGDALSNIAIIVGAVAIHMTGARGSIRCSASPSACWCCGPASAFCASRRTFFSKAARGICSVEEVARAILDVEGVLEVHDVHIWSLGGGHNALSLHARIPDMHLDECERLLAAIQEKAAKEFRIDHTTVQLESAGLPARSGYVMPEPVKK